MRFDHIKDTHKYIPDVLSIIREGIDKRRNDLKRNSREGLNTQLLVDTFNVIGTTSNNQWIGVQKEHESENRKGREDIYFHLNDDNYTRLFYIEAKRLPKYRTNNKEEYVINDEQKNKKSGGIERYKLLLHGDQNLRCNGMIAYVETKSVSDWVLLINEKLKFTYPVDTNLESNGNLNEFISKHQYESQITDSFIMHHFWIDLV